MVILERLADNPVKARVECQQCKTQYIREYHSVKKNPNGVCNDCSKVNKVAELDKHVEQHNKETNGLFIIRFTDRRQKCLVRCKHCATEYERLYKPDIYEQYGCKKCSRTIAAEHTRKYPNVRHTDRLYRIFNSMLNRTGEYGTGDRNYLELDIKVCKEWVDDRAKFFDWAFKNGYKENLTIDRRENSKGYSPDNCRWVTPTVQSRNQRKLKSTNTSGFRGVSLTQSKLQYRARIKVTGKEIQLGVSPDPKECAIMYDSYVRKNNLEHTTNFTLKVLTRLQREYLEAKLEYLQPN